jgi:hypothetical protein
VSGKSGDDGRETLRLAIAGACGLLPKDVSEATELPAVMMKRMAITIWCGMRMTHLSGEACGPVTPSFSSNPKTQS